MSHEMIIAIGAIFVFGVIGTVYFLLKNKNAQTVVQDVAQANVIKKAIAEADAAAEAVKKDIK